MLINNQLGLGQGFEQLRRRMGMGQIEFREAKKRLNFLKVVTVDEFNCPSQDLPQSYCILGKLRLRNFIGGIWMPLC